MSDESANEAILEPETKERKPLLWPAVVIVAAQLIVFAVTYLTASSTMAGAIGFTMVPLATTGLLILWWLALGRVTWRDRLIGLAVFIAAIPAMMYLQSPADYRVLIIGLPLLVVLTSMGFIITSSWAWPRRRVAMLGFVIGSVALVSMLRVDGVQHTLLPSVSLRWEAIAEQELAASTVEGVVHSDIVVELPDEPGKDDWIGFRGANRDGHVPGVTFATNWNERPPEELWRRDVGLGWSSVTVIGDYVFTQEQRGDREAVVCYRLSDGEEVWLNAVTARFNDPMGSGPRGTPTYSAGKLYVQGATGIVQCIDAASGETVWSRDIAEDTGARTPQWGFSSSPLVVDGLVILFSGATNDKSVIAYQADTGDIAWTSGAGSHGYSSGHLATIGGIPQILMSSNLGIQSFDPATGDLLWEDVWDIKDMPRVVQPIIVDDEHVIAGTGQRTGARLLTVRHEDEAWTVEEGWTSKRFRPYFNDIVYFEGYCYGFDGNRLGCINGDTGERMWQAGRFGGQLLLLPDMEMLLVLSEAGDVVLVEAKPDAFTEVARMNVLSSKTWNHPVIAQGKLIVRNDQEAACFALPGVE